MRRNFTKLLSLIMTLCMLVGIMPMWLFVSAADVDDADYLFFATDRHTNTSIIGNMINYMESDIGENELEYLGLGGDMVGSGESHPTYNSSTVLGEVTGATSSLDATNVDIVAGIHDMNVTDGAGIVLPYSGGGAQIYEGDKYYVYGVPESCISGAVSGVTPSTEADEFVTWANGSTIDKSKVIIVLSHYPLHKRRNDNTYAYEWADALNTVAAGDDTTIDRDVVFFWGHNHTGETSADTDVYHVAPKNTISVQGGSSSQTIYFTYANAGYLNAKSSATLLSITDTTITFNKYVNSSVSTTNSVTRVVTATPKTLAVTLGTTEYTVGDELQNPTSAVVTYDDGSTKELDVTKLSLTITTTDGADLEDNKFTKAGTYNLAYSYTENGQEATATHTVTVKDSVNTVYCYSSEEGGYYFEATGLGLESITSTYVYNEYEAVIKELFYDGVAYEIALEGHTDGNEITYYVEFDELLTTENIGLYYIDENNNAVPVSYKLVTEENITYIQFTTTYVGVFAYGNVAVPEGYELSHITVDYSGATKYLVGDTLDMVNIVVKAVYTKEGAEDFTCQLSAYGYGVEDGYTYEWPDMNTAGTKTIEITYNGKTASFKVTVYKKVFPDETTGVSIEVTVPGATEIEVKEISSSNGTVSSAIAHLLSDYVAYDIELEGYNDGEKVTVTLPVPEGVENPVVYYVSDDGKTVTNMKAVKNDDGTVSFETDHFSNYVVGESTEITVPDPEKATGSGETTTTTKKTVYVLTSSISSGNDYLIVNGNSAGSYYALANNSGSVAATGVTVKTDSTIGTYIELDDATDELWTVSNSYRFQNGSYYLGYTTSGNWNTTYTFGLSTTARTWSYSNNRLSTSVGSWSSTTYYLRYNNGWTWTNSSSESGRSVYFYVPTEVEVETTTTVSGTYSIAGNPDDITKVVVDGTTATLSSTLTFTPESGTANTEDVSTVAKYEIVTVDTNGNTVNGDPNGIISGINGNTVTFTGKYGKALVKVSYTTAFGEVTNYIVVTATAPTYHVDITLGGATVTGTTVTEKGITAGQTLQLGTNLFYEDGDGKEPIALPEGAVIEWHIPEEYQNIATVDHDTGLVTLNGVDGAFYVTATLTVNGKDYTVGVNFSVTASSYSVPSDGVSDFPEYPNEGSVRFDKTATAVGNFSETGITQIELSMTGVPYTTGSEIDVVVMLDMTGSMSDDGMEAAELATIAFVEKIVKNEDGSYNENRVAVYAFNSGSSSPYELVSLKSITSDSELTTASTAIKTASDKQASGGTPFDEAAEKCHDVLKAAKTDGIGNDRQQFCVFMSDGGPTAYRATYDNDNGYLDISNSGSGTSAITTYFSGYSSSTSSSWSFTLPSEYYTDLMKADGVTVYTVGLLLQNKPSNPSPYSSMTSSTYDSTTDTLTTIGSHYYFTSRVLKQMATDESKYIDIFDVDNADKATAAFESIAKSILQAATDVTVEDKITNEYTMIFDIPTGSNKIEGVTNDFYIEFVKYALDEDHERTTETSITKLYLKNTNGVYSATDSSGTAYAAPVFENKTIGDKGTLYYWTTDSSYASKAAVTYVVGETTYYFFPYGIDADDDAYDSTKWFNMTSGGYASGTVDSETNMSTDLVIATPYFVYNAGTKMLYWTVDKLDSTEYALRYFLYLDNSATEVGTNKEVDADTYPTNDHAYLTYTNFNGSDCRQEFVKPQMTWNGAQVSYVFYLVNENGQPINKSGQIVDFANATFITDVYTHSVVWNGDNAVEELNVEYLADELLPDAYTIYDEKAEYTIHVYQTSEGVTVFDYFIIEGSAEGTVNAVNGNTVKSDETTKVYNTKAGTKYSEYGIYSAEEVGTKFTTTDANGNSVTITTTKQASLDYSDTTVAFAVVWEPKLVEDTVVVDFGLDVVINVVENDILQNKVTGIGVGKDAYGSTEMNTGVSQTSKLGTAALTIEGNTISIENENAVRFSQGDMLFDAPVTFYYESPVEFYEGSEKQDGFMYSSVTVIPATTIYFEEKEFVDFKPSSVATGEFGTWTEVGTATSATQSQDRPGKSQISADLDADNLYGYDSAYDSCNEFSLGTAKKVTVNAATGTPTTAPTATFTFTGTGFDIISLTDSDSGLILVTVKDASGKVVAKKQVDNYYGYNYGEYVKNNVTLTGWYPDKNADGCIYQVPVIKMDLKTHGTYTVTIQVAYLQSFDHGITTDEYTNSNGSYSFWLDAIRIYDPAKGNEVADNAHKADGEQNPYYTTVRDLLVENAGSLLASGDTTTVGAVFIDGCIELDDENAAVNGEFNEVTDVEGNVTITGTTNIVDYANPGPNHETYLAYGQGVSFKLIADTEPTATHIGVKLAYGDSATLVIGEDDEITVSTATDMYYKLPVKFTLNASTGKYETGVIVLSNGSDDTTAVLSITNIKSVGVAVVAESTSETATTAMFMMMRMYAPVAEPDPFVPETFETSWIAGKAGKISVLTVTTSDDVESVTIDGNELAYVRLPIIKYENWKLSVTYVKVWMYTVKLGEGTHSYELVAYDADGLASEPVETSVTVVKNGRR